jgi:CHAD domain-containing protein
VKNNIIGAAKVDLDKTKIPIDSAAGAGRMLLHRQLEIWRSLEPSVRVANEPEALHELRVTARRMLAILQLLDSIPVTGASALRARLQALLRRTSAARDLDVQISDIGAVNRLTTQGALQGVLNRLARQRARQQDLLLHQLDSPRISRLFAALGRLAAQPSRLESRRPVTQVARQLIRRRYRKLHIAALRVAANPTAEHCHEMRLETKKLRYIGESLESAYGSPMRRFLRRLQKLQLTLGKINDAHHAMDCLELQRRNSRRSLSQEALSAMMRMRRRHARRVARYLAELPGVWHRVSGKRWRRLRQSLRSIEGGIPADHDSRVQRAA